MSHSTTPPGPPDRREPSLLPRLFRKLRPAGETSSGRASLLLRDSSLYLFGNLLQKAASFLLIPVYTTYLSTGQYGLLELAGTVVNLFLVVGALMVPNAINKCYHRDCHDDGARKRLVGTALVFTFSTSAGLGLLGWAFQHEIAGLLFSGPQGLLVYRYVLVWMILAQLAVIPLEILRTSGRSSSYLGLSFAQLVIQTCLIFYLVRFLNRGISGVLIGNVAGLVAVGLVASFMLRGSISWKLDKKLFSALLYFGVAMIPIFLSGWIINLSDRFFLQSMVGLGALGIYSLGYKFGSLVNLLLALPLQRAWTPMFYDLADREDAPRHLARYSTYLVAVMISFSLAISLAVPPFLRLSAAPEYHAASNVVPLICSAYILSGLASCLGSGLIVSGHVRLVALHSLLAAAANLLFNAMLIPALGMYGAALATVLAFGIQLGGILLSLSRHYPLRLEWVRLSALAVAGLGSLLVSFILPSLPLSLDIASRVALLLSFPLIAWQLRIVRSQDAAVLRDKLRVWGFLKDRE